MEGQFRSAFTDELRAASVRASQIARHFHHDRIDLAHFVLALIDAPSSAIDRVSRDKDPDFHNTRKRVRTFLKTLPKQRWKKLTVEDLSISTRVSVIIKQAQHLARLRGDRRISVEILFLALATEDFYTELEIGAVGARLLSPIDMTPCQIEGILFGPPKKREIGQSDR